MKRNSEYCISAGEFGKLCGATRDALRYYHQKGILVPRKDEDNGYHYYSHAQISSYYFIKTLREVGCSVGDIHKYLLAGEKTQFDSFIDHQYESLLEERRALEKRMSVIVNTRQLLTQIREADTGGPCRMRFPANMRLKMTPVLSSPATSSEEIMPDIQRHIAECNIPGVQPFPVGAVMDRELFLAENYCYKSVFSFAYEEAKEGEFERLPGREAAVIVCRDSDGDIAEVYRALVEFMKQEGREPKSDIYSLSIVNVIDPNEERKYLKYIFTCV